MASVLDVTSKPKTFYCNTCNKIYNAYRTLKQHVRKKHPEQIDSLAPSRKNRVLEFKCEYCTCQYSNFKNLRCHMRKMHSEKNNYLLIESMKKCALCNYEYPKKEIFTHFEQHHNLNLEFQVLNFIKFEDFEAWKKNIEKDTKSKFVLEKGVIRSKDGWKYNFICHRSGFYISEGKGLRHLKKQGSCKIDGFCPASIKMQKGIDNSCSVYYSSTHVGHQNDIDHITTKKDRRLIESKIALKVPLEIKWNMCKQEPLCIDEGMENNLNERNIVIAELSKNDGKKSKSLLEKRKSLKEKLEAIVDSIEVEEHFKIFEDTLKSITSKIEASKSS